MENSGPCRSRIPSKIAGTRGKSLTIPANTNAAKTPSITGSRRVKLDANEKEVLLLELFPQVAKTS